MQPRLPIRWMLRQAWSQYSFCRRKCRSVDDDLSLSPQRRFYAATQRDQPLTVPLPGPGIKVSAGAPHMYQDVHVCVGFCSHIRDCSGNTISV